MKLKKTVWTNLFFHTITVTVILVLCGLMTFVLSGCPEAQNMMQPVVSEPKDTEPPVVMGEVKKPEDKPAEPAEEAEEDATEEPSEPTEEVQEPEDTTPPTIIEVAWYRDWQMTQSLTADSVVHPGDTIYTTVVFSEPVVHTVADDDTARPALSIVADGMEERYTMLPHGVRFQSGDAKPLQGGTDDYLCKYTIPVGIVGTPALRIGSTTTDIAGNAAETSVHMAPFAITEPEPEPPQPHANDFTGQVVIPTATQEGAWRAHTRPAVGVTLTVLSGERTGEQSVTDENGNYRFADRAREIRSLRLQTEKEGFEPKEIIVHRSRPTETIDDGIHFSLPERKPQETPGTILVGHAWTDKVLFILEETALPHDLILVRVDDGLSERVGGLYWGGVILVKNTVCLLRTIVHELGHAHQHAVAVIEKGPNATPHEWENTSEGIAYLKAREKDWEEVGKAWYDGGRYLTPIENMAETAEFFWDIRGKFNTPQCFNTFKVAEKAPSRALWAEEWLGRQYD